MKTDSETSEMKETERRKAVDEAGIRDPADVEDDQDDDVDVVVS